MELRNEWKRILDENRTFYIYGAGKYGRVLFQQLKRAEREEDVCGFLVSNRYQNPEIIEGKPVIQASDLDNKNVLVLVAVSDQYQEEIMKELKRLYFKKVVNAYKYTFLEYNNEKSVEVIDVWKLLKKQYDNKVFCRFDIIVRLLAVEDYFGISTCGISLYRKMQDKRVKEGYSLIAEERFRHLIKSWEQKGYDEDSEIIVSNKYKLIDGAHRLALAIYFGLSYVKVRKIDKIARTDFGMEWFAQYFEKDECTEIMNKYKEIMLAR